MTATLLAINVGNTRTQIAAFREGRIVQQRRCANDRPEAVDSSVHELFDALHDGDEAAVFIASVNDQLAERLCESAGQWLRRRPVRIERDFPVPIGRKLDPEAIVGEDRLLNAAAAWDRLKTACIVVDAGTAVTVDFIDGEGTFHGGAILPGLKAQAAALHATASQLPEVTCERPTEAIGHNTVEAIRTGLFHGIRGAVRELAEKFAEVYQAYPSIVATGGDAVMLFEGYELVEAIVPDLTLMGISVAHRHAMLSDGNG